MSPVISVVVPVYNMGNSLERCVVSILQQECTRFEVILVDDGSTDDSWNICQRLSASDPRIRAFHIGNCGAGHARNFGTAHALGQYVYYSDSDDILSPHALQRMQDAVQESGADLLVFGYEVRDEKEHIQRIKNYPDFIQDGESIRQHYGDYVGMKTKYGIQGAPWNKLFSLHVIRENGVEYPSLRRNEDEVFIARYMCYAHKVQFISDQMYIHYGNSQALEWKKTPVDYADIVHALYRTRQETILSWNPADLRTRQVIREEYTDNLIKAFEMSFSPKHSLTAKQRRMWVADHLEHSGICQFEIYSDYSVYKKILLHLFQGKHFRLALAVMKGKIFLEKHRLDWMSKKYR